MNGKRIGAVVLVVVMLFGAVSAVSAQGPGGQGGSGPLADRPRLEAAQELLQAVADVTGLDLSDIRTQMRDGKTLSAILDAAGIDPQTVIDSVKTTLTAEINQAVTDGKITQERADRLLARLDDALNRAMNASLPAIRERIQTRVEDSLLGVIAEMAGVDVKDLLQEATTPPTLADIATAHGLDPDAIIAAAETHITEDIHQAVADGKITQERADEFLAGLHDRLVDRFNQPFRLLPGGLRDRNGQGWLGV